MKRVFITGMSGTGKSTVISRLTELGYKAIDTDAVEWLAVVETPAGQDEVWNEDRIQQLLSTEDAEVLFVSGCRTNQSKFSSQFDHIVLLTAPTDVIVERLANRTSNPYGKTPEQLARILGHIETVEPLLRRAATLQVDTGGVKVAQVVETILNHVRPLLTDPR